MAPPDGWLHSTLTAVADTSVKDVMVGSAATAFRVKGKWKYKFHSLNVWKQGYIGKVKYYQLYFVYDSLIGV